MHSSACFLNMGEKTCEIDHSFHSTSLMIPYQWLEASFQTEQYRNGRRFFLVYFFPILLGWSFFSHHINNSKKLGKLYTYKWTPKWHSLIINKPTYGVADRSNLRAIVSYNKLNFKYYLIPAYHLLPWMGPACVQTEVWPMDILKHTWTK